MQQVFERSVCEDISVHNRIPIKSKKPDKLNLPGFLIVSICTYSIYYFIYFCILNCCDCEPLPVNNVTKYCP